jgi:hypothetical protein
MKNSTVRFFPFALRNLRRKPLRTAVLIAHSLAGDGAGLRVVIRPQVNSVVSMAQRVLVPM